VPSSIPTLVPTDKLPHPLGRWNGCAVGNSFPNYISLKDAKPLLPRLRMVKDAGELQMIARATDASAAAHQGCSQGDPSWRHRKGNRRIDAI